MSDNKSPKQESVQFDESTKAETVGQLYGCHCEGKFVVITGCSHGGIGFEVARVLAKYGAEIFACCRTEESCHNTIRLIKGRDTLFICYFSFFTFFCWVHRVST
jgi:lactate dehydrogenase-like 2-hydroxyacid dehydrogenase